MNCFVVLAFLSALPGYASVELEEGSDEPQCGVHDELSLLQAFTGLKLQKKYGMLEGVAAADFEDASSFAQTGVQVAEAPAAVAQQADVPAAQSGADVPLFVAQQERSDEDAFCSLEGLTPGVCAMAGLARAPASKEQSSDLDFVHPERLERALFSEIESALGGTHAGFTAADLADMEKDLSGLFAALPKNEAGLLGHEAVRYAVHQRFLRRHAWYVRSLNPAGEAQHPTSPAEDLRGHVPQHVQGLLEKRSEGRGLGLRELTALVATLEHLIQGDVGERLKAAYAAHELLHNGTIGREQAGEVLRTFMAHFLSTEHRSGYAISPDQARQERKAIETTYDGWSYVDGFVQAVLRQGALRLQFADALAAAKEVMERFESYSVEECRGIKQRLMALPDGSTGRVLLKDFHQDAVDGEMLFAESATYLKALGAMDESEQGVPKVLVPNYIVSPSNCLGTTSFFDMCCPNECEAILEDVERNLQGSAATPLEVVGALDRARRWKPSVPLLRELERSAKEHDGRLVIHGFSFAQWLHRAFPRECPRPRAADFKYHSGDADELPSSESEFQAVVDVQLAASKSELLQEFQGNASAVSILAEGSDGTEGADELEGAATKALTGSTAPRTSGLKVFTGGLDYTSLAQSNLETSKPAEQAPVTEEEKPAGNTLRVKGV